MKGAFLTNTYRKEKTMKLFCTYYNLPTDMINECDFDPNADNIYPCKECVMCLINYNECQINGAPIPIMQNEGISDICDGSCESCRFNIKP